MTGGWTSFPRAERSAGIQIPVWRWNARLDSRSALRLAGMTGRGIHRAYSVGARHLSPHPGACGILGVPLPATGRGSIRSSRGSGRRLEGEPYGGLRFRRPGPAGSGEAPAMVAEPLPVKGLKARSAKLQRWGGAGKPKIGSGQKSPTRGRRKATQGPSRSRGAPQGALEEARPGLLGPEDNRPPGCQCGTRVPVAPPAFLPGTDGAWAALPKRRRRATRTPLSRVADRNSIVCL